MNNHKPEGFPTISTYLLLEGIPAFIEFAENVLGAQIVAKTANDDGVIFYATLKFEDSIIMAQEAHGTEGIAAANLYYYVRDVGSIYMKALEAGAVSIAEPQEHYHGDINAAVQDKWGNQWWFATSLEFPNDEEVAERRKQQNPSTEEV